MNGEKAVMAVARAAGGVISGLGRGLGLWRQHGITVHVSVSMGGGSDGVVKKKRRGAWKWLPVRVRRACWTAGLAGLAAWLLLLVTGS